MLASEDRFPIGADVTLHDLDADLHLTTARLRPSEPVSWVPAIDGWFVSGHAEATEVLRDAATFTVDDPRFSTMQVLGASMLSTDGDEHARHRRPFLAPFSRSSLTDTQGGIVDDVLARLIAGGQMRPIELRTTLARPLATEVIAKVLGLGVGAATVASWYDEFARLVNEISNGATLGDSEIVIGRDALEQAVAQTQDGSSAPRQASVIEQAASAAGDLSAAEFASNIGVVLFGAIETSEGMNAAALWHLLTIPGLLDDVVKDPTIIPALVDESLRLEPAAAVVDRYATCDTDLRGAQIRAGDFVQVSLAGANRDPRVFEDPDRFDPHRPERSRHLSFVVGPHACIGAHLARYQTQALLHAVTADMPRLALVEPENETPTGRIFRKPGPLLAA